MKRVFISLCFFMFLFAFQSTSIAAGAKAGGDSTVSDLYQDGKSKTVAPAVNAPEQTSPSLFPLIIKFVFSFILVIALLFVLLRYLSKRGGLNPGNGPIIPIGGHHLGNNRSIQVLLIGQTIYVVGVGETVSLLRTVEQGEEFQHLLESLENQPDYSSKNLLKDTNKIWNSIFQNHLQKMRKENSEE